MGVTAPHHVRVFWTRDGAIALQCKRWLTTPTWQPPVVLCVPSEIHSLREVCPGLQHPSWPAGFVNSAMVWLEKLQALLSHTRRSVDGLIHCKRLIAQELPEFLPSGETLRDKVAELRRLAGRSNLQGPMIELSEALQNAARAAFPGSSRNADELLPLIRSVGAATAQPGFELEPLKDGDFLIFRNQSDAPGVTRQQCPIRLAKALRVVTEATDPYVVVEGWWPRLKPEKYPQANLFGTWLPGLVPVVVGKTKRTKTTAGLQKQNIVPLTVVLTWPIDVEEGPDDGRKIPLTAFMHLRVAHSVDLSAPQFTFSKRGKSFYMDVAKSIARNLRGD